jgi:capsular exopolysaccharide synthesis family protein
LLEKRAEASITKASNISDHKIIDSPRLESKLPIKPNTTLIYVISVMLGIFLPTFGISVFFLFNNKILDKKDIDQITSIPLLGKIMHNDSGYNLVNANSPKSGIAESFRSIRTNIQYLASDKKEKVIGITSSVGGEGKTFVAMNLASIFSITGGKTVLIGADMRKPKIFNDFNLSNDKGLSSYLSNQNTKDEVIQKTNFENLDIILSGPIPPNPSELLSLEKMKDFIEELKKTYQHIIIDTPPIGLVTDGLILMKHCDVNIYVVRQNFTTKDMLNNFNETVIQNDVVNMNLIINDISNDRTSYGYGYGYGNTYGYGYYTEDQIQDNKPWWKR